MYKFAWVPVTKERIHCITTCAWKRWRSKGHENLNKTRRSFPSSIKEGLRNFWIRKEVSIFRNLLLRLVNTVQGWFNWTSDFIGLIATAIQVQDTQTISAVFNKTFYFHCTVQCFSDVISCGWVHYNCFKFLNRKIDVKHINIVQLCLSAVV